MFSFITVQSFKKTVYVVVNCSPPQRGLERVKLDITLWFEADQKEQYKNIVACNLYIEGKYLIIDQFLV